MMPNHKWRINKQIVKLHPTTQPNLTRWSGQNETTHFSRWIPIHLETSTILSILAFEHWVPPDTGEKKWDPGKSPECFPRKDFVNGMASWPFWRKQKVLWVILNQYEGCHYEGMDVSQRDANLSDSAQTHIDWWYRRKTLCIWRWTECTSTSNSDMHDLQHVKYVQMQWWLYIHTSSHVYMFAHMVICYVYDDILLESSPWTNFTTRKAPGSIKE